MENITKADIPFAVDNLRFFSAAARDTGGNHAGEFDQGYDFEPTVITEVAQSSEIVQKEVFGPVITIQSFESVPARYLNP